MKTIFACLISLMLFGSGLAYAGDYAVSAHGLNVNRGAIDSEYNTYGTGNCAHCHEAHASLDGAEPTPVKPGPDQVLLFSEEETVCEYCHDADGPATDNIKDQIDKDSTGSAHPTDNYAGRHSVSESTTTTMDPNDYADDQSARHAECVDCHNPHAARSVVHTMGTNVVGASSPIYKVSGIGVTHGGGWTIPSYTGIPTSTGITKEYQLCYKCHSSWTDQPAGQHNTAKEFNPANLAHHAVEAAGKITKVNMNDTFTTGSGLTVSSTIYCSDCHGSEDPADPKGPHGSTEDSLLAKSGITDSLNNDYICYKCHRVDVYGPDAGNASFSRFADHYRTGHHEGGTDVTYPSGVPAISCLVCHGDFGTGGGGIHGANSGHLTIDKTDEGYRFANGFGLEWVYPPVDGDVTCGSYLSGGIGCSKHEGLPRVYNQIW